MATATVIVENAKKFINLKLDAKEAVVLSAILSYLDGSSGLYLCASDIEDEIDKKLSSIGKNDKVIQGIVTSDESLRISRKIPDIEWDKVIK